MHARTVRGRWLAALIVAAAVIVGWRPLAALACDNLGNIAFAKGADAKAVAWFDRGLAYEPMWPLLLEDRGRARLDAQPRDALADFTRAACGSPCWEGAGDSHLRLGDVRAAIDDFVRARALAKLDEIARQLTASGDFGAAIAAERDLAAQFSQSLDQAQLAQTLWQIGRIEEMAGWSRPKRARAYRASAIAAYARAADLAPLNESYLLSYGMSEMQWGEKSSARRAFERLLQLHPHQIDAERALRRLGGAAESGGAR